MGRRFTLTFVIGGMASVLLAVPPADYVLHNRLSLVAHFHNVIIGGVVFGIFAGINYWFPKAFGFKLEPFWGKVCFWFWIAVFYIAFMPLYVLGLMGVTRRLSEFEDTVYSGCFLTAAVGAVCISIGIVAFFVQFYVSIRDHGRLRDLTDDPCEGRTLERSISSRPPHYNFASTPRGFEIDAWSHMKRNGYGRPTERYAPIHIPRYTATGIVIATLATVMGFALVWHIWWRCDADLRRIDRLRHRAQLRSWSRLLYARR